MLAERVRTSQPQTVATSGTVVWDFPAPANLIRPGGWWLTLWAALAADATATVTIRARDGLPQAGGTISRTFGAADLPSSQAIRVFIPWAFVQVSIVVTGVATSSSINVSGLYSDTPPVPEAGRFLYARQTQAIVHATAVDYTAPSGATGYRAYPTGLGASRALNIAEVDGTTTLGIYADNGATSISVPGVAGGWVPLIDRVSKITVTNKEASDDFSVTVYWEIDLWR